MAQFKQQCYYCGKPYSSKEHAPPRQLFIGFPCDKIKVPSCDDHNGEKSGSDNTVIKAMLIALDTVAGKYGIGVDAQKAINIAKAQFSQVKKQVTNIAKIKELPDLTYVGSLKEIEIWMRQLTAALVYHIVRKYDAGNLFDQATVFSPAVVKGQATSDIMEIAQALKMQKAQEDSLKAKKWYSGWPSGKTNYPQSVYNFTVTFDFDDEIVFRHHFFGSLVWYVAVKTSNESKERILRSV